jgi:hypothetical protein
MSVNSENKTRYRDDLARRSLDGWEHTDLPHAEKAKEAAQQLLAEFSALMEEYGWRKTEHFNRPAIRSPNGRTMVRIQVTDEGAITLWNENHFEEVPLVFHRRDGVMEGKELDDEVCPLPGHPKPRKDGMTAMVIALRALVPETTR